MEYFFLGPSSFVLDQIFAHTGRFSFHEAPTNLKVKKSEIVDNKRIIEFSYTKECYLLWQQRLPARRRKLHFVLVEERIRKCH
mmetsp:Transcript_12627/g.14263  ORF Transcript_12627/g.14263 Transcript_12627/m.14263 type:complete len:83 (+) Transcript_12627:558-806(+)